MVLMHEIELGENLYALHVHALLDTKLPCHS